jgi:hypothetical protein
MALAVPVFRGAAATMFLALAACSGGSDFSPGALMSGGRDVAAEQASAETYAVTAACPRVTIRQGTQTYPIYEPGRENDPAGVRFQATLARTARECRTDASGTTTVRVGLAGRMLAGPSGATGDATLPVRVALVRNGSEVISSTLHQVSTTVTATEPSVAWTLVDDTVVISPADATSSLDIFVGFDPGA